MIGLGSDNNMINICLIIMLLGARLGTFVREWRPAFCSSESQSPLLALWWGDVSDVGGDHGDEDRDDEGIRSCSHII